jgi:acyl-CoA synthetase (NDP forming)
MAPSSKHLQQLFEPTSIVIVGVSPKPSFANSILQNIISSGFDGKLAAINPNYRHVGEIECFARITDVPFKVDLAIICVRAEFIEAVLTDCAVHGVGAVQVVSSGFAELGTEEGAERQRELTRWARETGTTLVGPNTIGVINLHRPLVAVESKMPPLIAGGVSGVFQSGQLVGTMMPLIGRGIGVSKIASTGNEAGISTADVIQYFAEDPKTDIIISYSEGIKDRDALTIACTSAHERGKPIIMIRVGASPEARAGIRRHTASSGAHDVYRSDVEFLRELGVILVNSVEDLIETVVAFKATGCPKGSRIAFTSFSGGMGNIIADLILSEDSLVLPEFSKELTGKLKEILPRFANCFNPLDLSGQSAFDTAVLRGSLRALAESREFDILLWGKDLPVSIDPSSPLGAALGEVIEDHPELIVVPVSLVNKAVGSTQNDGTPPQLQGRPFLQGTAVAIRAIARVLDWHRRRHTSNSQ